LSHSDDNAPFKARWSIGFPFDWNPGCTPFRSLRRSVEKQD